MFTIKNDAKEKSRNPYCLDNFRSRYVEIDWSTGRSVIFPSFEIYAYEHHFFRLLSEAKKETFKPRWEKRPDYASFDMYETEVYWTLLLFVNNIFSIEDFVDLDFIFVPPMNLVRSIVDDRVSKSEIEVINKETIAPVNIFKMFARRQITKTQNDNNQMIENIKSMNSVNIDDLITTKLLDEKIENITLTENDLVNQYIILPNNVLNETSIVLFVGDFSIPQKYGYDYVLKYDSNINLNIVSWQDADCIGRKSNMKYLLVEGDILHIKYVYQVTG